MPMKNTNQTARLFHCSHCHQQVSICSHCDRGNRYCGSACRLKARTLNRQSANKIYQCSLKGRLKHANRQSRYRARKRATEKKVTYQGSPVLPPNDLLPAQPDENKSQLIRKRCHFCGDEVALFLRNSFLRHHKKDDFSFWPFEPS